MNQRCIRHFVVVLLGTAFLFQTSGPPRATADETNLTWNAFRGPTGQGTSDVTGIPSRWSAEENIVWRVELPGAGTSSPILVGEDVILTCYSGYAVPGQDAGDMDELRRHVVRLQQADGATKWTTEIPSVLPEQANIRDGHGYASSTPCADEERIYTFFGKSGVVALDHAGRKLWHADVGSGLNGWGSASSPMLFEDLLIVNASVESESLVALDKATGNEVWRVAGIRESWNTPIIAQTNDGVTELVVAMFGKVLGINPRNGEQRWSCDTDIPWYMVPSLVASDGVVYCIGGRSGGALAVRLGGRGDVTSTHRLWVGRKGSNVSSPILHQGHLYWMHDNLGIAYCAKADTGEIQYEQRVSGAGQIYASPILADDKIYYVSREGRIFVVAARPEFELLANNDLRDGGVFNAAMAAGNGRLYLRSDKFLYCIGDR